MTRVPFVLITGFLGSGKTTLLKQIIRSQPERRIGIVQNEFAPANIDGSELKNEPGHFELLEINNGSAFCVCLLGNFITSLAAFVKSAKPELVVMEASGLSDPIAIAELFNTPELSNLLYLSGVCAVIDGANFIRYQQANTRVKHQIRVADLVLINKCDLSSKEELIKTEKAIAAINPFGTIKQTSYASCITDTLFQFAPHAPAAFRLDSGDKSIQPSGRPEVRAGVFKTVRTISRDKLVELVDNYSKTTIRMKGFIKLSGGKSIALQSCYDRWELRELDGYYGPTELIAMGADFNLGIFGKEFRDLAD